MPRSKVRIGRWGYVALPEDSECYSEPPRFGSVAWSFRGGFVPKALVSKGPGAQAPGALDTGSLDTGASFS
jgi:hypothetical protein